MRIISFVPSLTETLIYAEANVVGRTRFCIHPSDKVKLIPIVGGTKDFDIQKINELNPDIILLDKEENTIEHDLQLNFPKLITHVIDLKSLMQELIKISEVIENKKIYELAMRLGRVLKMGPDSKKVNDLISKNFIRINRVDSKDSDIALDLEKVFQNINSGFLALDYVIWKSPWMVVNKNTFIGSVIHWFGWKIKERDTDMRYITLSELNSESVYLFSSEPYPFHKKISEIQAEGLSGFVVNGESFSWYGVRTIQFLEDFAK